MANGAPTVSNGLVISGVTTVTTLDLNGDLDVDGHLNADNVSIAGVVTATSFVGNLTGNPTGTLQTAAQPNITSVGTLSALTVSGNVNCSAGDISIGTGTPRQKLHIHASDSGASNMVFTNATTGNSAGDGFIVGITGGEDAQLNMQESADLKFSTADTERFRITSDGYLKIGGHSANRDVGGLSAQMVHLEGTSGAASISLINNQNSGGNSALYLGKSRGTSIGSNVILQNGDPMGSIVWCGSDGNDMISQGAVIAAEVDGTPGSNDMPGRLVFKTTADGAATPTERLRIHSTGQVTKPASCAFNVTANGNQTLSSGGTLTSWKTTDSRGFENTTTGGYFGSGIFTAPVTGAYYFTSSILLMDTNGTNSIHLYWQKNGSGTHTYWNTRFNSGDFGYQNYMPVAGACTMYLSAGDTCRIRISFSGSSCGMYGADQNWGNWGGFLIG
tara:strand:- start:101 stop:1438 length:1338 start_codon:yes stop_codon:yes gene_type:complete